ncbi:hypothetical protein BH23GEM7_BH23GEM7_22310 [soil metagenome]
MICTDSMRRQIVPVCTAMLLLLLSAAAGVAQSRSLEGSYTYLRAASDDINQAIERGIAGMNFVTRPVARGRLRKTNEPFGAITISRTPAEVAIATDGGAPVVTPADGSAVRWRREDGEVFQVSTALRDGVLRQTFVADDGQRENALSLSADGDTLTMRVTVTSPRLPRPVSYRLVYLRAAVR